MDLFDRLWTAQYQVMDKLFGYCDDLEIFIIDFFILLLICLFVSVLWEMRAGFRKFARAAVQAMGVNLGLLLGSALIVVLTIASQLLRLTKSIRLAQKRVRCFVRQMRREVE